MKLSEAIRKGAAMRPQGFGGFLANDRTCAMGAACDAVGIPISPGDGLLSEAGKRLFEAFPILEQATQDPPVHTTYNEIKALHNRIWQLNDLNQWTRERIADWVESIENKTPQKPRESDTAYYVRQMAEIQRVTVDA